MSDRFNSEAYNERKTELENVIKKILNYEQRQLPSDDNEREIRTQTYKAELLDSYNNYVQYTGKYYNGFSEKSKASVNSTLSNFKLRILRALQIFQKTTDLPEKFDLLREENIVDSLDDNDIHTEIFVTPSGKNTTFGESSSCISASSTLQKESNSSTQITTESPKQNDRNTEHSIPTDQIAEKSTPIDKNSENLISVDSISVDQTTEKSTTTDTNSGNSSSTGQYSAQNTQNHPKQNINPVIQETQSQNSQNLVSLPLGNTNPNMATLSLSDILNGIPDFSSKSQDDIKQFIAKAGMIHSLAPTQSDTILTVIRAKLATANKLGDISNSPWNDIKASINNKYRATLSFETAQERLLAIKQGPKESLDDYANRTKNLLDALNASTNNDNNAVQCANRTMNESLAIRKFKQNIFEEKIRLMALSAEHTSLAEAIAHSVEKKEQLNSSNVVKIDIQPDNKTESKQENKNQNRGKRYNKFATKKPPCIHCKKTNHLADECFFKETSYASKNPSKNPIEKQQFNKSLNTNSAAVEHVTNPDAQLPMQQNLMPAQQQIMNLQPYHYLNC